MGAGSIDRLQEETVEIASLLFDWKIISSSDFSGLHYFNYALMLVTSFLALRPYTL